MNVSQFLSHDSPEVHECDCLSAIFQRIYHCMIPLFVDATAHTTFVQQMEDCLDDIKQWMTWNFMCMNDGRTQYLPIVPKSVAALVDGSVICVGVSTITASRCV